MELELECRIFQPSMSPGYIITGGYADMLCEIERAWTEGCLAAQAVCELEATNKAKQREPEGEEEEGNLDVTEPDSEWEPVMRRAKILSLMNYIWEWHIKSWSCHMFRCRQINLKDGLLHQSKLCDVVRHSSFSNFINTGNPSKSV